MIGIHRPERLVEKVDYCLQGQGHSEGSKCRCLSRYYFLNRKTFCYQTRYCDPSDSLAIFKVKVKTRARMIKIWQFLLYLLYCWSFCYKTWFNGTLSLARVSYEEIGLLCSGSRSRQNCKMSMTVYLDAVFWNAEPYTTKLGTVMQHHEPNCLQKILVCCLQGQGHSEVFMSPKMTL